MTRPKRTKDPNQIAKAVIDTATARIFPSDIAAARAKKMRGFHIRIDDGTEQFFSIMSTAYRDAAAAVPAIYDRSLPCARRALIGTSHPCGRKRLRCLQPIRLARPISLCAYQIAKSRQ
ncbi:hypothetical protein ACVIWV_005764 [Bradyrhizobium diazoefficiens]|uniref:Uncharacterized protein n=1 Tax=Bradyrhizobium barranii subsp. barranii TaxID=2823807 RepID=A0A939MD09_9BRAD|nr:MULTISPECIES: hypothetical protein [Bradyrhizobium]MBR0867766.1 hypothetical protein [Bradyrhizobium diazoefficiens]MBR0892264.1 hypothetical protein [Bradyrhizobium diazoefficiens]MBR0923970.1 hypothetical protein [Bradyrhizobium diazoefficiens]UEM09265.1 hypothetical protein J4G43_031560 [Bradyrhizobium barranii subsp. barranii]